MFSSRDTPTLPTALADSISRYSATDAVRHRKDIMKAEEIEVERLFRAGDQFVVPVWQRPYSWRSSQWQELWDDIHRLEDDADSSHFVGSVVLHAQDFDGGASEGHRFLVVDGQQRVATLTVLICAIRDRLARLESDDEARQRVQRKYTASLLINGDHDEEYRERLVLQDADQSALRRVVAAAVNADAATSIERAYLFFSDKLSDSASEQLVKLLKTVRTRLTAVWVVLQTGDNAHRVFQTLNAGGKPLEQVDLVRNYFFLLLGVEGESFYLDRWKDLEKDLASPELEGFLVAWAVSQGHNGSKGSLFEYVQKDLGPAESEIAKILAYGEEFVAASRLYRYILRPGEIPNIQPETRRTLMTLKRWGTIPAEGLLLHLLRLYQQGRMTEKQLASASEVILSFFARRFLGAYTPNRHKSIFTRVTHRLIAKPELEGQEIVQYLSALLSLGEDENAWPTDALLVDRVASTPVYTRSRSKWVFLVLERINRSHFEYVEHAPESLDDAIYTVEHILPQTLSKHWEEDLKTWGVDSPAQLHETHVHVLGNLTLSAINSHLGNRRLAEKTAMLADDTLRLNQELAGAASWEAHDIDERGRALIERAIKLFVPPLTRGEIDALAVLDDTDVATTIEAQELPDIDDDLVGED